MSIAKLVLFLILSLSYSCSSQIQQKQRKIASALDGNNQLFFVKDKKVLSVISCTEARELYKGLTQEANDYLMFSVLMSEVCQLLGSRMKPEIVLMYESNELLNEVTSHGHLIGQTAKGNNIYDVEMSMLRSFNHKNFSRVWGSAINNISY